MWDLDDPHLDAEIHERLMICEMAAEHLVLEIAESAMMSDPAHEQSMPLGPHDMGVRLAVADLGAGFSSLAYLKKFPAREPKIDKSFVMDMMADENDAVIVRSTIDLARNLGLKVVAEGVEDRDILDMLYSLGCDIGQEHHFGRALMADARLEWLSQKRDVVLS